MVSATGLLSITGVGGGHTEEALQANSWTVDADRKIALGWLNLACGGNVIWKME